MIAHLNSRSMTASCGIMVAVTNTPKTVHKAMRLLREVTARPGATLAELAEAVDVPTATAHRLLRALQAEDLVRTTDAHAYHLGSWCLVLGQAYLADIDLRAEARPFLEKLVADTGETAHLGVLTGTSMVYVDKVDTSHPVRMYSRVGALSPVYCTGMGKALLAHADQPTFDRIVEAGLHRRTPNTITDPDRLQAELERTRARGFSIDDIENEEGIRCAGAAVLGADGVPLAAISVAGPAARLTESRLFDIGEQVATAARELSMTFGYEEGARR
jgi:IclR family acetate operon transcriptional repressor